ncbi:MAG: hypothetical protein NT123_26235 [Proteobacteria bacterium]|nr:hypothetical protein [Pseudomonadota bacterium]
MKKTLIAAALLSGLFAWTGAIAADPFPAKRSNCPRRSARR